jgi:uncharacterized protein YndB with AHSA1/START domain
LLRKIAQGNHVEERDLPSLLVLIPLLAAALIAAALGLAALKPPRFRVGRELLILAPPARVFALLDDLRSWERWAPQEGDAATVRRSYGGAARGLGAVAEWQGSGRAGAGRMEIVEAQAPARLVVQVDFLRPFRARNFNEFTLEPFGQGTLVRWSMDGSNVFVLKLMTLWLDIDKLMGKHFEDGLAGLRRCAEQQNEG